MVKKWESNICPSISDHFGKDTLRPLTTLAYELLGSAAVMKITHPLVWAGRETLACWGRRTAHARTTAKLTQVRISVGKLRSYQLGKRKASLRELCKQLQELRSRDKCCLSCFECRDRHRGRLSKHRACQTQYCWCRDLVEAYLFGLQTVL